MRAMLLAYVLVVFLYIATRFQHMGRYLLPILPLLAVAASYGVSARSPSDRASSPAVAALVVALTGAYALAFHAIYTRADDAPGRQRVDHGERARGFADRERALGRHAPVGGLAAGYPLVTVPVFEPDDETKLRKLYDALSRADYYSLSSPRAWRTIGRLPDRYPLMVRSTSSSSPAGWASARLRRSRRSRGCRASSSTTSTPRRRSGSTTTPR